MASSSNTSIAKKARTKAEADFATWLKMPSSVVSMTFHQTHRAF
jgi:hypothetical protein